MPKPIKSWKKGSSDKCDKSVLSAMKANTIKFILKTVLAMKHRTYNRVDTAFVVPYSEKALQK